jgi:hypothetical protein
LNNISTGGFSLPILLKGESNGKLPLRTCPKCSMPEPYRSPDWALVAAETGPRAEYKLLLLKHNRMTLIKLHGTNLLPQKLDV